MTLDKLIKTLKIYYGKWSTDAIEKTTRSYIEQNIKPNRYKDLKQYIFIYHPLRYKAPGIASIESAIRNSIKDRRGDDCRIIKSLDTRVSIKKVTKEDDLKNQFIFKKYGGLMGWVNKKRVKK